MDYDIPPPPARHDEDSAAYATLLNTVESLQADLQQTVTTCHGLREANATLSRNFDAAKDELLRQREKVAANRAELIRASKVKLEADRQTETLVAKRGSGVLDAAAFERTACRRRKRRSKRRSYGTLVRGRIRGDALVRGRFAATPRPGPG